MIKYLTIVLSLCLTPFVYGQKTSKIDKLRIDSVKTVAKINELNTTISGAKDRIVVEKDKLDKLNVELSEIQSKYNQAISDLNSNTAKVGQGKKYANKVAQNAKDAQTYAEKLKKQNDKIDKQTSKLDKLNSQATKSTDKIEKLEDKLEKITGKLK
ncbi:MAG: hypothetical protein U0U66_02100 [Cytophagaceae bacterium]